MRFTHSGVARSFLICGYGDAFWCNLMAKLYSAEINFNQRKISIKTRKLYRNSNHQTIKEFTVQNTDQRNSLNKGLIKETPCTREFIGIQTTSKCRHR